MNSGAEQGKVSELTNDAKSALIDLLRFDGLTEEQWFMRLSIQGKTPTWELLTADSQKNNLLIKGKIAQAATAPK